MVTKDEILAHLNLGGADGGGEGKYAATGKGGLTKDLIEGLEKDLDKLKRTEENLKMRKLQQTKGGQMLLNVTDEEKERNILDSLHNDLKKEDAHIIHAD